MHSRQTSCRELGRLCEVVGTVVVERLGDLERDSDQRLPLSCAFASYPMPSPPHRRPLRAKGGLRSLPCLVVPLRPPAPDHVATTATSGWMID